MRRTAQLLLAALLPMWLATSAVAQFEEDRNANGLRLGREQTIRVVIGVNVRAVGGPCTGIYATVPVPMEWPEQQVTIVEEDVSAFVTDLDYRTVDDGVQQMLIRIPRLPVGETAQALVTFEVTRQEVERPDNRDSLVIQENLPRELRGYLGPSPYIEVRHPEIRAAADELWDENLTAWEQVQKNYDWVRSEVEYVNGPLKGAVQALRDGDGDCEELTSLFIAICRAQGIPARTVWVPGHCYPEFYLVDGDGVGNWYPCQIAGEREFGHISDLRYILQKGDNFDVPEHRERQRYAAEFLQGNTRRGNGTPEVRFVQSLVPVPE